MSFSSDIKEDLLHKRSEKRCCQLSEIHAFTQTCASLRLAGRGRMRIAYQTENPGVAKRILSLLKTRMHMTLSLSFKRQARFGGRRQFILLVSEEDSMRLLTELHMAQATENGMQFTGASRMTLTRRCCRAAYARAAFLGSGSVTAPEKGYHLEFVTSGNRTDTLIKILEASGIHASVAARRGADVVYIRKADDVEACLALMGAHKGVFQINDVRINRSGRNQANRARNCDEANLMRQLSAGKRQAQAIIQYSLKHSLSALSPELQELGRLRMLHADASLEELGNMLEKPIGKSGVSHRMQKLMQQISQG